MELKAYRHNTMKDLYLVRTDACGGTEITRFYETTHDVLDAIRSYNSHNTENGTNDFMLWHQIFPNNKVKTTLYKEMKFDGYEGKLKKTVEIPISEFELITFVEEENAE